MTIGPPLTVGYLEIDEAAVPLANRRAASAALAFGRRDLELPPFRVRWFDVAPQGVSPVHFTSTGNAKRGRCGLRDDGSRDVWIRGARAAMFRHGPYEIFVDPMTPYKTAETMLHELAHASGCDEDGAVAYHERHRKLARDMGRPGWPQRR